MIKNRFIIEEDYPILENSLKNDEYHKETPLDFFLEPMTVCSVYEDETGIVLFARGKAITNNQIAMIQLDLQFIDNNDTKRNLKTMLGGFQELEQKAKENGFVGFFFNSDVPVLKKFCVKRLGFEDHGDFLVKIFQKKSLDKVEEEML